MKRLLEENIIETLEEFSLEENTVKEEEIYAFLFMQRPRNRDIFLMYFGLFDNKRYKVEEIAKRYHLSNTEVITIIIDMLYHLKRSLERMENKTLFITNQIKQTKYKKLVALFESQIFKLMSLEHGMEKGAIITAYLEGYPTEKIETLLNVRKVRTRINQEQLSKKM